MVEIGECRYWEGAQIKQFSDPFYNGLMTFWEGSKELSWPLSQLIPH